MKRILLIVVLTIAVPSLVLGQAKDKVKKAEHQSQAGQLSKSEEEILKLENDYLDARLNNDQATIDRILADD